MDRRLTGTNGLTPFRGNVLFLVIVCGEVFCLHAKVSGYLTVQRSEEAIASSGTRVTDSVSCRVENGIEPALDEHPAHVVISLQPLD